MHSLNNINRVGIEIEFLCKLDLCKLAEMLAYKWYKKEAYSVCEFTKNSETRIKYTVVDPKGSTWAFVIDKSVCDRDNGILVGYELVTPVISDLYYLRDVLAVLLDAGCYVNNTCGLHIHIDKPELQQAVNLLKWFASSQDGIVSLFGIPSCRLIRFCKKYPQSFVQGLSTREFKDYDDLLRFYHELLNGKVFGSSSYWKDDSNPARYYLLNFNSLCKIGTIEFRLFNSTLSFLVIKGYINWLESIPCISA